MKKIPLLRLIPAYLWKKRKRILAFLLLALIALNVLAYIHAYRMTHFVAGGEHIGKPESLSVGQKLGVLFFGVEVPRPESALTPAKFDLPFETLSIPVNDDVTLSAWLIPHPSEKGVVVLFHGYAACKAHLLPEANAFHELGYTTVLVDFRGSGGSSGDTTTIGVHETDDVAAACAYVRDKLNKPYTLFGQSMGAAAVLRALVLDKIEPAGVILECPFNRMLATVENRFSAMGVPSFPCAQLLVFWGGVQHGFNGFRHNPAEYAASVRCPVLLMNGDRDPRVTVENAREIADNLKNCVRFEVFEGVGHQSYEQARPEQWRIAIEKFLSRPE